MKRLSVLSMLPSREVLVAALFLVLAFPPDLFSQATAEDHIVNPQAMQQQLESSSANRQKDIATVTGFLASPQAERAMRDAHINPAQVRTAIPTLSDQELASLSARASDAQQKFAAGWHQHTTCLAASSFFWCRYHHCRGGTLIPGAAPSAALFLLCGSCVGRGVRSRSGSMFPLCINRKRDAEPHPLRWLWSIGRGSAASPPDPIVMPCSSSASCIRAKNTASRHRPCRSICASTAFWLLP